MHANMSLGAAGLTGLSGSNTTFTTGNAIDYTIDGKAYSKAAVTGGTTPTTDNDGNAISLTASQGTVVVWALDSSGTVTLLRGSVEKLDDEGNFKVYPQFPTIPNDLAPFGYSVHKAASNVSGTFTVGSSNWDTTGMTHTVQDVATLPSQPQNS